MANYVFTTPVVAARTWWRIDTASGSDTPAVITPPGGGAPVIGSLRADDRGVLSAPKFWGTAATLYLKQITEDIVGTVIGGTTQALTGSQIIDAAPGSGSGVSNGNIVLVTPPATTNAVNALPTGVSSASTSGGVRVGSSYPGDDDGTGADGTGRVLLYSYQRANVRSYGETIRNFLMRSDAKAMTAWYGCSALYDATTREAASSSFKPWTWTGSHFEANDHASIHGHWEVEVPDAAGALQGRLEIPFIDQSQIGNAIDATTIGVDYTNIRTNLADFSIRAQNITTGTYSGQTTCLRIGGGNDRVKDILLSISSEMNTSGRRWALRANTETESTANAGTNFQILRYADDGTLISTAFGIRRSDGNVFVGSSSALAAKLGVTWTNGGVHGILLTPSAGSSGGAAVASILTATTDRALQTGVTGDVIAARWVVWGDGKTEWGDGAVSRDTNLYRSSATVLKTDGSLTVVQNLRINTTSTAAGVGVLAMANATTVPSTTPSGGGVTYVEAGALKYKGSSGTVTVLAPA